MAQVEKGEEFEEVIKFGDQPAEFLAAMQKEYPPLVNILTTKQVRLLAKPPTAPYPIGDKNVNEEYLDDLMAYFRARIIVKEAKKTLQGELMTPVTSDKSVLVKETNVPILVNRKVRVCKPINSNSSVSMTSLYTRYT